MEKERDWRRARLARRVRRSRELFSSCGLVWRRMLLSPKTKRRATFVSRPSADPSFVGKLRSSLVERLARMRLPGTPWLGRGQQCDLLLGQLLPHLAKCSKRCRMYYAMGWSARQVLKAVWSRIRPSFCAQDVVVYLVDEYGGHILT